MLRQKGPSYSIPVATRKIAKFSERTGCNDSDSRQYLQDSEWDVDLAVALYMSTRPKSNMNNPPSLFPTRPPGSIDPPKPKPQPAPAAKRTGIAGFSDFSSKEPEDDKKTKWYTGGEKSGLQVEAPPKSEDIKNSVFDNARRLGATDGSSENNTFAGQAYRLGNPISKPETTQKDSRVCVTFWKNGFSVDDGPLRSFNDPVNRQFIASIEKGEVPQELAERSSGADVDVDLKDRHSEDYVAPPPKPFENSTGNKLGGVSSTVSAVAGQDQPFTVDSNKPTTSVQIRLTDGSRLVGKFNTDHKVLHIRTFINQSKPNGSKNYSLSTALPQKIISDENATLQEAGLVNAVVIQKAN